ncbi:MAG: hypothetical protein HWD84_09615 [Flavobacteriaceae bacterium]|nr:hypothetical protein [Flavobacteriaceae bacterium]
MSRLKTCSRCQKEQSVMYRVQYQSDRIWYFLCKSCTIQVKENNALYRYGGTWKG